MGVKVDAASQHIPGPDAARQTTIAAAHKFPQEGLPSYLPPRLKPGVGLISWPWRAQLLDLYQTLISEPVESY